MSNGFTKKMIWQIRSEMFYVSNCFQVKYFTSEMKYKLDGLQVKCFTSQKLPLLNVSLGESQTHVRVYTMHMHVCVCVCVHVCWWNRATGNSHSSLYGENCTEGMFVCFFKLFDQFTKNVKRERERDCKKIQTGAAQRLLQNSNKSDMKINAEKTEKTKWLFILRNANFFFCSFLLFFILQTISRAHMWHLCDSMTLPLTTALLHFSFLPSHSSTQNI